MNPRCAQAVKAAALAAGKALTKAQVQAIDDGLSAKMRALARTDPAWSSKPYDQQLSEAGKEMMADIKAAAARKADLAYKQIVKTAETENRITSLQDSFKDTKHHDGTRVESLKADEVNTGHYITGLRKMAQGGLMNLIEASGDKTGVGMGRRLLMSVFDAENPGMTRDIAREVFRNADGSTGNKAATAGARAWLDTIEGLRTRFNAAGGDVGKLAYGYVPQPHDLARIKKAGREAWALVTLQHLDRARYLREDGSRMDDGEVIDMLHKAWDTIVTDGMNKQVPGTFHGSGKRANRGSDERQIHFADGDAWSAYMKDFGKGTLYDSMMSHIGGITRDIGLVERYGPDANANFRLQLDLAAQEDGTQLSKLVGTLAVDPKTYWSMLTGTHGTPADERLSSTMSTIRNVQGAAKLGGAVISSVTDLGTLVMTTGYNRLPYWQLMKDVITAGTKDGRDMMSAHGMIAESTADSINRFSGDNIGTSWSGKMLNGVMRLTLMNKWTDGLRQGFTLSMNAGLARMAKKDWGSLDEFDRSRLTRAGFTEADWQHLNGSAPVMFKGRELITPDSVGRGDLAAKVFGFIHDESEFAVVNPDMAARAYTTGGQHGQAGTSTGEIARTVMQFKSFPVAMMTRHWNRLLEGDHDAQGAPLMANRAAYAFALMATTTGLGAVAYQTKQMLAGKDPVDMFGDHAAGFWTRAVLQGGGLSIAGDMLLSPGAGYGDEASNVGKNLLGPAVGSVLDLGLTNIKGNIQQAAEGKDTHWEAELSRWATSNTPGGNLWWLKPMVDHGFMNAMNEGLSPGYLARMKARALNQSGQRYWWEPNRLEPSRTPEFSAR